MQNLYNSDSGSTEPLTTVGGITAVVTAILPLVVVFRLPLTGAQTEAILGVIAAVAPFVVATVGTLTSLRQIERLPQPSRNSDSGAGEQFPLRARCRRRR